jgi:hypothetical protein
MLRNLLRRWLLNKDLDKNFIELYSEHRTILQLFGEWTKRVYRAEEEISKLRNTGPEVFLHLRTLEERIDALEAVLNPLTPPYHPLRKPPVQQEDALRLRLPSLDDLSDLIDNYPGVDTWPCSTRNRLLFEFGRQWQNMSTTGKIISCDKSAADANAISEALSKLRVLVNPGNNGDQPDRLSDSPDA